MIIGFRLDKVFQTEIYFQAWKIYTAYFQEGWQWFWSCLASLFMYSWWILKWDWLHKNRFSCCTTSNWSASRTFRSMILKVGTAGMFFQKSSRHGVILKGRKKEIPVNRGLGKKKKHFKVATYMTCDINESQSTRIRTQGCILSNIKWTPWLFFFLFHRQCWDEIRTLAISSIKSNYITLTSWTHW